MILLLLLASLSSLPVIGSAGRSRCAACRGRRKVHGRVASHVCGCLGDECLASALRAEWVVDGCRLPVVPERRFPGKRPRCSVRENVSGDFSGNLQISLHTFPAALSQTANLLHGASYRQEGGSCRFHPAYTHYPNPASFVMLIHQQSFCGPSRHG